MKIAVVAPYFYPRIGGLENYALGIAKGLRENGHEVLVITSNDTSRKRIEESIDGIRVIRLAPLLVLSNTPVHPLWYFQIKAIFRQEKPDVILGHTPVPFIADMAARAAGRTPFVLTYHNDLSKDNKILKMAASLFWHLLGKGTLRRAGRIVATSQFYADSSPYLRPFADKTVIIPPGVDASRFNTRVDASAVKHKFIGKQIVLFVGSLSRTHAHKGLDLLINSVAGLRRDNPSLHLVVVGQGNNLESYRRQAQLLGIQGDVTFTGFVTDDDLPAYYASAAAFVLPSTNPAEGFGMVLLEAAACGTPVVGTNVGGIPAALELAGSANLAEPNVASITTVLNTVLASARRSSPAKNPHSWSSAAAMTEAALEAARRPRVALIHNVIAPYRLPMFEQLSASTNLEVLFTQTTIKDREWQNQLGKYSFSSRLLPSFALGPLAFNRGALRTLLRSRFDVLITNTDPDTAPLSITSLVVAKLRRRPIIVWSEVTEEKIQSVPALTFATSKPLAALGRFVSWGVLCYRKVFFRNASSCLAFSEEARQFLVRNGVPESRILRTFEIMPEELLPPPQANPNRNGKSLLFVGYLSKHKNAALLINAFLTIADPKAKLTIVGTGEEEPNLRELAAGDVRIEFAGFTDGQPKAELYRSHDILVLPTRRDCWGLVVNEAIHYGLAVIVSDAAAAKEIVDPASGIVFPSDNIQSLAAAIGELLTNPQKLRRIQRHNASLLAVSDTAMAVEPFTAAIAEAAG